MSLFVVLYQDLPSVLLYLYTLLVELTYLLPRKEGIIRVVVSCLTLTLTGTGVKPVRVKPVGCQEGAAT